MYFELTFNEQTHKSFQRSGDKTSYGIQGGIVLRLVSYMNRLHIIHFYI